MFKHKQEILDLFYFKNIFEKMRSKDPQTTENIQTSIMNSVSGIYDELSKSNATIETTKYNLLKAKITFQAQASQFLNISEQIALREQKLWEFTIDNIDMFFERFYDLLELYFMEKRKIMFQEITSDISWYSGLKDTAKKSGSILNWAVKNVNEISKDLTGSRVFTEDNVIDDKTLVESLLEKHLNYHKVGFEVSKLLEQASEEFEKAWLKEISLQIPKIEQFSAFGPTYKAGTSLNITFQLGTAEQTFMMGIGSAVAGTLGLAVGWHTITYALINVFPPIAFFALAITIVAGVVTQERVIDGRKKQVEEAIKQYHRYFLTQMEVMPIKEIGDITVRKYMKKLSEKIIAETISQWERSLLGKLSIEDFRILNSAFTKHLILIQEALDNLEDLEDK